MPTVPPWEKTKMIEEAESSNSTHKAEVFQIEKIDNHAGADALEIVNCAGYQTVVRKGEYQSGDKVVFVCPDSVVSVTRPEFTFLADRAKADGTVRIKAKKLRGVISFGLLVRAPEGANVGDDLAEAMGITHYQPPEGNGGGKGGFFMGGECASGPDLPAPKYDLEAFRRYHHLFSPGESVVISEKCDGASARYVYFNGEFHCGSRTTWKRMYCTVPTLEELIAKGCPEEKAVEVLDRASNRALKKNLWWDILEKTPSLEKFCRDNPGVVVYGEIAGNINCIKYSFPDVNRFYAFDVMKDGRWLDPYMARDITCEIDDNFPWVPHVPNTGKYDFDQTCALAEGETLTKDAKPGTIREGIVIQPINERYDPHLGRVKLKCVSGTFLEKYR